MWCVMRVRVGSEESVRLQCQKKLSSDLLKGCYVFYYQEKKHIQGEWVIRENILFPGYVFIETDKIEDFHKRLNRIYAMTKVLRTGDEMTPIQKEEEEYLRKLGGDEHVVRYSEGYIEGDKLVVTSGPLKDFEGNVKKVLRHKRLVVVEVPLLGRTVEVTVGMGVVERR